MKRFFVKYMESWWLAPTWFAGTLMVLMPFGCIALGFLGWVLKKAGGPEGLPDVLSGAGFVVGALFLLLFAGLTLASVVHSLAKRKWLRALGTLALCLALWTLCSLGPTPKETYGPDYYKTRDGQTSSDHSHPAQTETSEQP